MAAESSHKPTIDAHGVDCFFTRLDGSVPRDVLEKCLAVMSCREKLRADTYRNAKDRNLSIVSRGLLRFMLSQYLDCSAGSLEFAMDEFGKPFLKGCANLQGLEFNLSHTRDMVACVITRQGPVGVDIEACDRKVNTAVAKRFFTAREADQVFRAGPDAQRERFLSLWTLKEAYIKARGRGLSLSLSSFSFELEIPGQIRFSAHDPQIKEDHWQFFQCNPFEDAVAAIAVESMSPVFLSCYTCVPFGKITPLVRPIRASVVVVENRGNP